MVKNPPAKRCRFDPWVRKIPWERAWQPTPAFSPGESHGQRRLVKSQDMTERLSMHAHTHAQVYKNRLVRTLKYTTGKADINNNNKPTQSKPAAEMKANTRQGKESGTVVVNAFQNIWRRNAHTHFHSKLSSVP